MYKLKNAHVIPFVANADSAARIGTGESHEEICTENGGDINIEENIKINDELFINASHELKTPLNIIYSAAQLIELYIKCDEENEGFDKIKFSLDSIKQNSFRLMKVVNNMLDLHKIETGLYKLNHNYVNIVELVEEVVSAVSKIIDENKLKFVFDTNLEEKYMMVDVEGIERVLLNILSNAVKFSRQEGEINVNVLVKDDSVEISVADEGIGIKKNYLNNIFNRFGQIDKSLSRKAEGSGTGLRLAKAITEMHGGSIKASSKMGKGSIFTIKLPCRKNENIYSLDNCRVINYDSLGEMVRIEFADIDKSS